MAMRLHVPLNKYDKASELAAKQTRLLQVLLVYEVLRNNWGVNNRNNRNNGTHGSPDSALR